MIFSDIKNKSVKLPFVTKNSKHLVGTGAENLLALIEFTRLWKIHLIPKWRRPRMVWVELHENKALRAREHKRFYEATTGKWTYCEFRKKSTKTTNYHSLPTWLRKAKAFLADEYLHEIQTHQDQSYFYYRVKCFHSFKVREEPHNLKLALCIVSGEVE